VRKEQERKIFHYEERVHEEVLQVAVFAQMREERTMPEHFENGIGIEKTHTFSK
jgi:hypothetical protein